MIVSQGTLEPPFYIILSIVYYVILDTQFIPLDCCGVPLPRLVRAYVHDLQHAGRILECSLIFQKCQDRSTWRLCCLSKDLQLPFQLDGYKVSADPIPAM